MQTGSFIFDPGSTSSSLLLGILGRNAAGLNSIPTDLFDHFGFLKNGT
jgi:hypothetical protein